MKRAAALLTALTLLCSCASGQGVQSAGAEGQNDPAARNSKSKRELFEKECEKLGASGGIDPERIEALKNEVEAAFKP